MRILRRLFLIFFLLLLGVVIWAAIYAQKKGFTRTWREMVEAEFANRGYYVDIGKMTLGPFQGLLAEDVRFFQDPERKKELGFVDNVILDLDLSDILDSDLSVNALDVQDAQLMLPLEPGKRDSEQLRIDRFSARLVVTESQIEIVRAQAQVAGAVVSVKGSLFRAPNVAKSKRAELTEEQAKELQKQQLNEIRRRIGWVQWVVRELEKFQFAPEKPPRFEIEFAGDLGDLSHLRGEVRVTAQDFRRGAYAMKSLDLKAEYSGEERRGLLRDLHLRDSAGDLRLRGDWPLPERRINFELESTADLPALVAAWWPNPRFGEVVFFSPPRIQAEGTVRLDELKNTSWQRVPGKVMGELRSERFASRGAVFEGMEMQFAAEEDRFYVRNLRLDHKSGMLLANLMFDPARAEEGKGFQFQSEMKLDPAILLPFVRSERTKRFVSDWKFDESSAVYFAAIGEGESLNPDSWETQGVIDLRGFRRGNEPFDHLETEYEAKGRVHQFRNLMVQRPEGALTAELIRHDIEARTWETKGLRSTMDLMATLRAVTPSLARALEPIRFSQPPEIEMDGLVENREPTGDPGAPAARHDFELSFRSDQPLTFDFLGKSLPLQNPSGTVKASGGRIRLARFDADLFGGHAKATFEAERVQQDRTYSATIGLDQVSSDQLVNFFGNDEKKFSGMWTGALQLNGKLGDPASIGGKGSAILSEGDCLNLPSFSGIPAVLPSMPLPPAPVEPASAEPAEPEEEAVSAVEVVEPASPEARFSIALQKQVISIENLEAITAEASLSGGGTIDAGKPEWPVEFRLKALRKGDKPVALRAIGPFSSPVWQASKAVKTP